MALTLQALSGKFKIQACAVFLMLFSVKAGGLRLPVQAIPEGIVSINGSVVNMGCTAELTDVDGITTCGSRGDGAMSYLIDGFSPEIDTGDPNWASQLVVMKRNENASASADYALLTFGFETDVSPTAIEIDLFLCSDWNFWVSRIFVYVNEEFDLVFTSTLSRYDVSPYLLDSLCGSLSTVALSPYNINSYQTFHIVMDFPFNEPEFQYIHIGEVRFVGIQFEGNRKSKPNFPIIQLLIQTQLLLQLLLQ